MGDTPPGAALPSYERPPVTEVAVGVHYLQLPGMNAVTLVRLAEMWRKRYPKSQEQPALPPVAPGSGPTFAFQLQTAFPPLRLWLLSEDEAFLIQVQHDRLLLNWRQTKPEDPYPRYSAMRTEFIALWSDFAASEEVADLGVLQPLWAEVTFFNRIAVESAAGLSGVIAPINPNWDIDNKVSTSMQIGRSITSPRGESATGRQNIALGYPADDGILHLEISSMVGMDTADTSPEGVLTTLDEAHALGVQTFDHVTTQAAHDKWGKI